MLIIIILHIAVALTPPSCSCLSSRSRSMDHARLPNRYERRCGLFRLEHVATSVLSNADQDAEGQYIARNLLTRFYCIKFIAFGTVN